MRVSVHQQRKPAINNEPARFIIYDNTKFRNRSRRVVFRANVVKINTKTLAVNNSVLTNTRMTKPVGKVKLEISVTRDGLVSRREEAPPAMRRLKRAPYERKAPARNDLRSKSANDSRAFAIPDLMSRDTVSFVGS